MSNGKWPRKNVGKIVIAVFLALMVVGLAVGGLMVAARVQGAGEVKPEMSPQMNTCYVVDDQSGHAPDGGPGCVPRADEILPVSETMCKPGFDVERGWIKADWNIPNTLPICVKNESITAWTGMYEVYGGYMPEDGFINVVQPKTQHQGVIYYYFEYVTHKPCCTDIYQVHFYVKQPFCLDSNHRPVWYWLGDADEVDSEKTLGKEVNLCIVENWKGCDKPEQHFTKISARTTQVLGELPPIHPFPHPLNLNYF